MNKTFSTILTASLAIFSMFFGAGNLIYPLGVGITSGTHFWSGVLGFLTTSIFLPLLGLVSIVLFDGNYETFFERLGKSFGFLMILFSMFVIGPLIAMPRIVTLTYEFLTPFMPALSLSTFSMLFCFLTFIAIYKENRFMNILAYVISPALLISLAIIIIKGYITATTSFVPATIEPLKTFTLQAIVGYGTLDLLAALFFGSIVLMFLKKSFDSHNNYNLNKLALITIQSGIIACAFIALIYVGIAFLGAFYGPGLSGNPAQLFMNVCSTVMGTHGSFLIAIATSCACYSTIMALAIVLAEFVQNKVTDNRISYITSLICVLILTFIISCYGLDTIMNSSAAFINTLYPAVIATVFCNLAYKLFGFPYIKMPVFLTLCVSIYFNFFA